MKSKILIFLLAVVMLFCACNQGATPSNSSSNTQLDSSPIISVPDDSSPVDSNPADTGPDTPAPDGDNEQCENNGHKDENDDGYCDVCYEVVIVDLDFYAINDLHGKFTTNETNVGVEGLTTYLKNNADENSIVLSSGDMWQGGSESNLTKGLIVTEWLNEVDTVAMTLGNHEYDWGEEYIIANAEVAEFPFLAINIYQSDTDQPVDYCQPSVMIERSGVKIGIIGAIGDCYSSISADKVQDVYFKVGDELTELVKAESQKLRNEGADIVVYSLHDGYGSSSSSPKSISSSQLYYYGSELSRGGYIDLVFEGHSHQYYVLTDTYGVCHLQGGGDNKGISHATLSYNIANKNKSVEGRYVRNSAYSSLQKDAVIDELLEKYAEQIAAGYKVYGYNDKVRSSDELRDILAMLYLEKGIEEWGDEYEIVLGGGYMSARSPYDLAVGDITYAMLQSIFPFDNALVLCSIKGSDLLTRFINTDNSNYYCAYEDGLADKVKANSTYYIIVDKYSSQYAPNRLTEIEDYHDQNYFARDMLAEYIAEGNMCSSKMIEATISEILEIGKTLSVGASTEDLYITTGTIVSIASTTYGNMTIRDESGNTLYVYGVYDLAGVRYDSMTTKPKVGDSVTLRSIIKNYSGTIEFVNATLMSIN